MQRQELRVSGGRDAVAHRVALIVAWLSLSSGAGLEATAVGPDTPGDITGASGAGERAAEAGRVPVSTMFVRRHRPSAALPEGSPGMGSFRASEDGRGRGGARPAPMTFHMAPARSCRMRRLERVPFNAVTTHDVGCGAKRVASCSP